MSEPPDTDVSPLRIGVILVHGVGEQTRFEYLDEYGRDIIRAIGYQPGVEVTVDIDTAGAAAFHAEQDSWTNGPRGAVQGFVRQNGRVTHCLHFHEVWWADVNERYSLAKQLRFWLWGLAIWAYPRGNPEHELHGTNDVTSPFVPNGNGVWHRRWQIGRLFMVGVVFLLGGATVGIGMLLVQRLLNLRTPDLLKTVTNYVSGVKLFNQRSRYGPGFAIHPPNDDFLDTLDEPPRVSVRRRMIRAIATVAAADYDRWYVIAHSQGTVAAFNGLMETPYAWPGYFDAPTWAALRGKFGGPGKAGPANLPTMPRRPVWATPNEIAYRTRIFQRFRGFLTLGSPLEKFAAIWPARVPISRMCAFRKNTVWINVFDPLDPISGVLKAYQGHGDDVCPPPANIGYPSSPFLLIAHLRYLTWTGPGCLADGVAKWLLTDDSHHVTALPRSFSPDHAQSRRRTVGAWLWWFAAFALLALLGGWIVGATASRLLGAPPCVCTPPANLCGWLADAWSWLCPHRLIRYAAWLIVVAFIGPIVVGGVSRWLLFRASEDPKDPPTTGGPLPDPGPRAPLLSPRS